MFTRVRGNTILFAMPLQGKTFYAGAIVVDDFVPQDGDEITVVMQDRRAYTYTPTYTDGMLIWTDNGQLEVGTYSVEVLVDRQDGTHLRCLRVNQVNIVESTEESELDSNDSENGVYPSDILSAGVFLFAGSGNLGIREIAQDVFDTSIGPVQAAIVNGYTAAIGTSLRNVIPNTWVTLEGNEGDYANRLINANHIPIGSGLTLNPTTGLIDVTGGGGGGGVSLNQPLSAINEANLGLPSVDNSVISWNSTDGWCYKTPAILGAALASINNAGLPANPDASNKTIVWDGSAWTYAAITGGGGVVVSDVKFGDPTVPAEKDKLVVKKGDTDYYRDILFAQVAQKTRFSYTIGGTTYTDAEFPIDWLIAEEYTAGHYRLRVNPKYEGLYADGWVAAGGIGSGGGGGVTLNQPLSAINTAGLGAPSVDNSVISWNANDGWCYKTPAILGAALTAINNAGLTANPDAANKTIVWDGSAWTYAALSGLPATISAYGAVKLGTSTVLTIDSSSKVYPVGMTSSGQLAVEVPWSGGGGGGGSSVSWGTSGADYIPLTVDGVTKNLLTSHQSLSGYATQTWVGNQGYLTSTDLNGYATESWVTGKNYLTSAVTSLNSLSGAVSLSNGNNVSISKSGNTITIAATDTNTTYKLSLNGTVNGDNAGTSLGTLYAPTGGGTAGQVLLAGGNNTAPSWTNSLYVSSGNTFVAGDLYIGGTTAYIEYSNGLHTNVGFYSDSFIAAGGIGSSSDRRLKDGLEPVSSDRALSVLMRLKPMEWVWNEKNDYLCGKRGAGLVAQDVMDVLPFAVNDTNEYFSLFYSVFHAYEIAGLQNHEERIAELEKKLAYAAR